MGWHAVALILEDFPTSGPQKPLSEVPLQFLVEVREQNETGTMQCRTRLNFISTTLRDNNCVAIPPGSTFATSIVVTEQEVSK